MMMQGSIALQKQRELQGNSVHSIALVNVLQRLEFLYGDSLEFKVNSEQGHGTTFTICFELKEASDEA